MNPTIDRAALVSDVRAVVRSIPDFPKPGILFRDITTVLADGPVFRRVCAYLADLARRCGAEAIAGVESRGFVFAAPVAAELALPLVLLRKPGKLPWKTRKCSYDLEYGKDSIEVHEDSLRPGQRVLILDDLLATGGTMAAAVRLVRELGGDVVAVSFVIELPELGGRARLGDVPIDVLVGFEGH